MSNVVFDGGHLYVRKSKYRIVHIETPGMDSYYVAHVYKTREAPNGDYWEEVSSTKRNTPHDSKAALLKSLMRETVVEEFEL